MYTKKILEIRKKLIDEYSSIIRIRNHSCFTAVKKIENDNIKNFNNNSLCVNFDYYVYPYLINLLDRLLNGDIAAIGEIIAFKQIHLKKQNLKNEIFVNQVCQGISSLLDVDFTSRDLIYYINSENSVLINNEDYSELKNELIDCITFERIDSLDFKEFYKVINFLEYNSNNIINEKNGVKKKIKDKKN